MRKIPIIFDIENWLWKSELCNVRDQIHNWALICQRPFKVRKCLFPFNYPRVWCGNCWKILKWYLISMLWQNSLWPNILQSVRKKGMQKWTEPFYFFPDASQRATCLSKYDVIGKVANCIEIWKPNIHILAFLSIVFNNKYGRNNCLVFKDSTALPMSEFSYPFVFTKYF